MRIMEHEHGMAYLGSFGMLQDAEDEYVECWGGCDERIPVVAAVWVRATWHDRDGDAYQGWAQASPVPCCATCVEQDGLEVWVER